MKQFDAVSKAQKNSLFHNLSKTNPHHSFHLHDWIKNSRNSKTDQKTTDSKRKRICEPDTLIKSSVRADRQLYLEKMLNTNLIIVFCTPAPSTN